MLTEHDMQALRHGFNTDIDIPKLMQEYEYAERNGSANNSYNQTFFQEMYQLYHSLLTQHNITTWTKDHTLLLRDACITAKVSFGTIVIYVMVATPKSSTPSHDTCMYHSIRVDEIATHQPFGKNYTVLQVWQQVCYQLQDRLLLSDDITLHVDLHQFKTVRGNKARRETVVRDWEEAYMRDDLDVTQLFVHLRLLE
tara:strand:- start:30 stop:620 length:591 start_codon:yes stop_codon:yes gene_type:complete